MVELAPDMSIFVGANNSGKTSVAQAIQAFVSGSKEKFSLYDFSSHCWKLLDILGEESAETVDLTKLPVIALDLWLEVAAADLHRVVDILPGLKWRGKHVGVRIEFGAKNAQYLMENYRAARAKAIEQLKRLGKDAGQYVPWPKSLSDYLHKELRAEYELRHFVLDRAQFNEQFEQTDDYTPLPLAKDHAGSASVLRSLICVDCLEAQRHLSDTAASSIPSGGRAEDLSKLLSRFYKRNLDQREDDQSALKALFDSELGLNAHLKAVFEITLKKLEKLGYPGLNNPRIEIRSALNPTSVMNQDARVHYMLGDGDSSVTLPDTYNGLGYKNLIYMVVEVLDRQERWKTSENDRAPLHLIFIEEPEAHLHAQLQQVFIRNILELMRIESESGGNFTTQAIITTHSPHMLYERGFTPIRYFRRSADENGQSCTVLNLSRFYQETDPKDRDFLQRYLKLTHCDLFFADAAILVEGNVERLLLPAMIAKSAKGLRSACLSILEVGGAFGHRFRTLVEHLGITALIITDIDSVERTSPADQTEDDEEIEALEEPAQKDGADPKPRITYRTCEVSKAETLTANQTLIKWLPRLRTIAELVAAADEAKTQEPTASAPAKIRVTYQTVQDVHFGGTTGRFAGRTLEEAFGLENAAWCQADAQKHLKLKLRTMPATPAALATGLHKRVISQTFDKTQFALGVLTEKESDWVVPAYVREGLIWLNKQVDLEKEEEMAAEAAVGSESEPIVELEGDEAK